MDPISISLVIDLGAIVLGTVAGIAAWVKHVNNDADRQQRDSHHEELNRLERAARARRPAARK